MTLDVSAGIVATGSGSESAIISGLTLTGLGDDRRRLQNKDMTGTYLDSIDFLFSFENYGDLTIDNVEVTDINNPFLYVGGTEQLTISEFHFHNCETNTTIFDCGDVSNLTKSFCIILICARNVSI